MAKVKICGIRRIEDVLITNCFEIDYIGFIFANSFRRVSKQQAMELANINKSAETVGVFVNEDVDIIIDIANSVGLDVIQLHGDEDQDIIGYLKEKTNCKIWKAIRVKDKSALNDLNYDYDRYLYDSYSDVRYGGNGIQIDHRIIKELNMNDSILAGGVNIDNINKMLMYNPYCLDISSGIEVDGYKNYDKLKRIMEVIRQ